MFSYRNLFKNSIRLAWRNKNLWFFGLFTAIFGMGAEYDFVLNFFVNKTDQSDNIFIRLKESGIFNSHLLGNIASAFAVNPFASLIALMILLMVVFLACFMIWLVAISVTAVINNSGQAIGGKAPSFRDGIEAGVKKFWTVFSLAAAQKIITAIFIFILGLSMLYSKDNFRILYVFLFVIFLLSSVVASWLFKFSLGFIILKAKNVKTALKEASALIRKNWIVLIEMEFFLLGLSCLGILALFLATLNIYIIWWIIAGFLVKIFGYAYILLGVLLAAALMTVSSIILTLFNYISWNNLFIELIGGGGTSKLLRLTGRFSKNSYDASNQKD